MGTERSRQLIKEHSGSDNPDHAGELGRLTTDCPGMREVCCCAGGYYPLRISRLINRGLMKKILIPISNSDKTLPQVMRWGKRKKLTRAERRARIGRFFSGLIK